MIAFATYALAEHRWNRTLLFAQPGILTLQLKLSFVDLSQARLRFSSIATPSELVGQIFSHYRIS